MQGLVKIIGFLLIAKMILLRKFATMTVDRVFIDTNAFDELFADGPVAGDISPYSFISPR
ncbi:hypothetical protein SAMN04488057_101423 [Cyclobacterium lianum]|uniref:Uncharacterized protein n=1 Tax=Cyclobacterium lianum TaxID=388280 RepID=A0A1M7IQE5_9BACT|nr:hypothetical protein SAMN04488057_101423 [Cyclobacterium lianum]